MPKMEPTLSEDYENVKTTMFAWGFEFTIDK